MLCVFGTAAPCTSKQPSTAWRLPKRTDCVATRCLACAQRALLATGLLLLALPEVHDQPRCHVQAPWNSVQIDPLGLVAVVAVAGQPKAFDCRLA